MSCYLPGAGQFYNQEPGKGVAQLGLFIGGLVIGIAELPYDKAVVTGYDEWGNAYGYYEHHGNDGASAAGFVLAGVVWIWSVVDAPGGAERYNRKHGLSLYEDSLHHKSLALEPVLLRENERPDPGMQVAYRF
jgi:TM2 domain-containing membrane protein YozV